MTVNTEITELINKNKRNKLFTDRKNISKLAKSMLNTTSVYTAIYVLSIIEDANRDYTNEDIDQIFKTIE
ncbi:hypothetical protein HERIO_2101 [Hepatospora eriocheir]|uniref:Uncharacterized protein n=1 Tax=Hepatospora eriocheir TaxID=1081669 RepID=A0A1X0Q881_9MICR|nr:hypothetical protein HERIO_2101 [Hepatospora eriocheir]